jgi:hypothetical protein
VTDPERELVPDENRQLFELTITAEAEVIPGDPEEDQWPSA